MLGLFNLQIVLTSLSILPFFITEYEDCTLFNHTTYVYLYINCNEYLNVCGSLMFCRIGLGTLMAGAHHVSDGMLHAAAEE